MMPYDEILGLVAARTGLVFAPPRLDGAAAGVRRSMKRARVGDVRRYCTMLEESAETLDDLVGELTVGETYFFREPEQFSLIRREILPEIRHRRGDTHVVRCWSAGCASGEEAFSLAMVLADEGLLRDRARVYATDISRRALAKARAATYGEWSLRDSGAGRARAYLERRGDSYELSPEIRASVAVQYGNLALDEYPSFASGLWGMDLVLCRNVLIYLDSAIIPVVARRLFASLADGGWIITGPSDPLLTGCAPFESLMTEAGIVYRRPPTPDRIQSLSHAAGATPSAGPLRGSGEPNDGEVKPDTSTIVATARAALSEGDYRRAVQLTSALRADPAATLVRIRALANIDTRAAEVECERALARHPLNPELHYLRAALLIDQGRDGDAVEALRRVLYLDRSIAAAQYALGAVLRRRGDVEGARRAYRNASELARAHSPDAVLPLTDGESAGRLATAAASELALLGCREVQT